MKLNERVSFNHITESCGWVIPGRIAFDHKDTFLIAFKEESLPETFRISTHYPKEFDSWTARPEGFTEMFSNFPNCKFKWIAKSDDRLSPLEVPLENLIYKLEKEVI